MKNDIEISKRLSFWLRHDPAKANLTLDPQGWTDVDSVLTALAAADLPSGLDRLFGVIESNDKQRFELSPDKTRIRARQGHSVTVELDWPALPPPELLYHGTVERLIPALLVEGLKPMRRHHVHLSADVETARKVGMRHGVPAIIVVRAGELANTGVAFLRTANGVWLVDAVPPSFIELLPGPA